MSNSKLIIQNSKLFDFKKVLDLEYLASQLEAVGALYCLVQAAQAQRLDGSPLVLAVADVAAYPGQAQRAALFGLLAEVQIDISLCHVRLLHLLRHRHHRARPGRCGHRRHAHRGPVRARRHGHHEVR